MLVIYSKIKQENTDSLTGFLNVLSHSDSLLDTVYNHADRLINTTTKRKILIVKIFWLNSNSQ